MAVEQTPLLQAEENANDAALKGDAPTRPAHRARIPHLDGLRAIAIVGVLLFHFEVKGIDGGFVGVDMFFTISGFLITRNIIRTLAAGRFSLVQFYKRRFFRLYPASITTIALTLLLTCVVVRPYFTDAIFMSGVAAMTFWSNSFFHHQGGYFYSTYEMRPLLHFWSLSVEEQFYLFWPPLIILVATITKNPRVLPTVLAILSAISLTFATIINVKHSSWAFYELPSRVFQFAAGAMLTLVIDKLGTHRYLEEPNNSSSPTPTYDTGGATQYPPAVSGRPPVPILNFGSDLQNFISVASLAIIVVSFVLMPESPSPLLVVPITLATCALIALPQVILSEMILSSYLFVLLGQMSYSIYLVHWPIYVLGRQILYAAGMGEKNLWLMGLSVLLGALLQYTVENPLRFGGGNSKQRRIFFALTLGTLAFAFGGIFTAGFQFRFPEAGLTGWPPGAIRPDFDNLCHDIRHEFSVLDPSVYVCRVGAVGSGKPSKFHFFGDSFTEHLTVALHEVGIREGVTFDMHYSFHCGFRPASEIEPTSDEGYNCVGGHHTMWSHLQEVPNGSMIVVANWWNTVPRLPTALIELRAGVHASGKELVIFAEPPGVNERFVNYYACADIAVLPLGRFLSFVQGKPFTGAAGCLDFSGGIAPEWIIGVERRVYDKIFDAQMKGTRFIDVFSFLCRQTVDNPEDRFLCRMPAYMDGVIYDIGYKHDLDHLSPVGSYNIAGFLREELYPSA